VAWGLLMVVVGAAGMALKVFLRQDLDRTEVQVTQLEDFLFSSSQAAGHFQETQRVLEVLEDAKTSLRGLSTYAPLNLVRQLHHLKSEPKLGGTLQRATLLFTDIAGFTSLSEQLSPNELAELLGLYLEVVTECIHHHGGVVDKFIGDAAMALWNVPIPLPEHPLEACRAAWEILERTAHLAETPAWKGRSAWVTRIGINTDEVLVGHFGSPKRMNYTALGDGVNLASRLEGLNKQYGSLILVSQAVYEEAQEEFAFCRLDRVAVVGKTMAVEVYQLLGPIEGLDAYLPPQVSLYEEALRLYFTRDFQGALAKLGLVQRIPASALLTERCKNLLIHPPREDWDGVYRATKK
jgi:adenylate cyclase